MKSFGSVFEGNSTIIISGNGKGKVISGENVSIVNGKVICDGKTYNISDYSDGPEINITVNGNVNTIENVANVTVKGDVKGDIDAGGSVTVTKDCYGNIDAGGHVEVNGNCGGNIDSGGSTHVGGNCEGDIDSSGSTTVNGNCNGSIDSCGKVIVGSTRKR